MGAESTLRAKVNGKADRGKALLETNEVVFRGAARCVVKLDDVRQSARVKGGWLVLGALELELGRAAEKWLAKIKNPRSVLDKLGVKPGQVAALIGGEAFSPPWRDADFGKQLGQRGLRVTREPKGADVIFFFVRGLADLEALPKLRKALPDDGTLWLIRPKGKDSPVGELQAMAAGKAAGLVDVKVVAFSETLSAEKYVVPLAARKPSPRGPR